MFLIANATESVSEIYCNQDIVTILTGDLYMHDVMIGRINCDVNRKISYHSYLDVSQEHLNALYMIVQTHDEDKICDYIIENSVIEYIKNDKLCRFTSTRSLSEDLVNIIDEVEC